jgi:hypothetical protein
MSTITMDAILANVFLTVQNRLASLLLDGVPELKFIDQDLGQLEFEESNSPVKFPCALFDIVDTKYTDNSEDSQLSEGILEVRLGVAAYAAATHYYTNDSHRINALYYYNLEHRVNQLLHGWSDDQYFNPLSRVSAKTERRKDNVRVRVLHYAFGFTDDTAMAVYSQLPRPDLIVDINPEDS